MPPPPVDHVVILVQENHTVDNYFRGLAPWGANVAGDWPLVGSPRPNPPHDRPHYFQWLSGNVAADTHTQFDTAADLPYYLYLAVTGAFLENHCSGFGTNSTPNHLLIVGGQSPTLRNPSSRQPAPSWDMPSLPGLADDHGLSWACYTPPDGYPVRFFPQLASSPHVKRTDAVIADAQAGTLPALSMVWHQSPLDEHPPADPGAGMNAIWKIVDAIVHAGLWERTVFLLTYDDWGGFDDHVATPVTEYTPDNVQLAYGPRVPLLMFGGHVRAGIDSRWSSHPGLPKTAMQLLGLPPLGVPRVDDDPGLADLVDAATVNPAPPAFGTPITLPAAPTPTPAPRPLPPPPPGAPQPVGPVLLRGGGTLPAPFDVHLPQQPQPPTNTGPGRTPVNPAAATRPLDVVLAPGSAAASAYARAAGSATGPGTRPTVVDAEAGQPHTAGPVIAPGFTPRPDLDLTDHGGHTITDLVAVGRYLGGATSWDDTDRTAIDRALTALLTDPGMQAIIGQYFPGPITSTVAASDYLPTPLGTHFYRDQAEAQLTQLVRDGTLATDDPARTVLYLVLPRGVILVDGNSDGTLDATATPTVTLDEDDVDSTHGLAGYHGSIHLDGTTHYYAIAVHSEPGNGIAAFDTSWKNIVATLYHELCEARTDPDVADAARTGNLSALGWYTDPSADTTKPAGEIGDLPITLAGHDLSTVMVEVRLADGTTAPTQLMWSNRVHGPEAPPT